MFIAGQDLFGTDDGLDIFKERARTRNLRFF